MHFFPIEFIWNIPAESVVAFSISEIIEDQKGPMQEKRKKKAIFILIPFSIG